MKSSAKTEQQDKQEEIERILLWIQHLRWVKKHPKREDPEELYQELIDLWSKKLQDLRKQQEE